MIRLGDKLVEQVLANGGNYSKALNIGARGFHFAQNDLETASVDVTKKFIDKWVEDWASCGIYFNTGNHPDGNARNHVQLAFATEESALDCIFGDDGENYEQGNLMHLDNHTIKYVMKIFGDFLSSTGPDVSKEEAAEIFNELPITKSDFFNEACEATEYDKKGNKYSTIKKQLKKRYEEDCKKLFKDDEFDGEDITSLFGMLDICYRAMLTFKTTGEKLHFLLQTVRTLDLGVETTKADQFKVRESAYAVMCPGIHPNHHERRLSTLTLGELEQLDLSYARWASPLAGRIVRISSGEYRLTPSGGCSCFTTLAARRVAKAGEKKEKNQKEKREAEEKRKERKRKVMALKNGRDRRVADAMKKCQEEFAQSKKQK